MNKNMAIEWLNAAKLDLDSISCIIEVENLTPVVAFHAQQAVEKSLKALLEYKQTRIAKIHKLQTLIERIDLDLEIDKSILIILDDLYIESRYPGDLGLLPNGKPTIADAEEFYNFAKEIFEKVKKIITTENSE